MFFLRQACGLSCLVNSHDTDPLVSVAHKFNLLFPLHFIGRNQFVTCHSYTNHMENQAILFNQLSHNNSYWTFVSTRDRIAYMPLHHEVEDFISYGIPPELRSKMWQALAGVKVSNEDICEYYGLTQNKHESFAHLIERDLERTFEINDPNFLGKLSRILTAYANHNPVVGYCQSMNILTATLLIFMPEELAFKMLVYVMDRVLPDFHCELMPGYHSAVEIFKFLIAVELPELHTHFQKIHFDISALTGAWFLSLYVHIMPNVTVFVVWDNILLKGPSAIYEVALAILRMQMNELLQIDNYEDMMLHIPKRLKELYNPNKLLKHCKPIGNEQVQIAREVTTRMESEVLRAENAIKCLVGDRSTLLTKAEIKDLYIQYVAKYPFLCCEGSGLNAMQFGQLLSGTFNKWYLDSNEIEHFFKIVDTNKDGMIDFPELACFINVISRGPFDAFIDLTMRIFDINGKGWMDQHDLVRMLQSMYGMFDLDNKYVENFVVDIFKFPTVALTQRITLENFRDIALVQPDILSRLKKRNSKVKYDLKATYFYWMSLFLLPHRTLEPIQITYNINRQQEPNRPSTLLSFSASTSFF